MAIRDKLLIEAAIAQHLVTEKQVDDARRDSRRAQVDELTSLCYKLRIPTSSFIHAYAAVNAMPFIRPSQLNVNEQLLRRVSPGFIRQFRALPIELQANENDIPPKIVTDTPDNPALHSQASRVFKGDVQVCVTEPDAMEYALQVATGHIPNIESFDAVNELNEILNQAFLNRASDVHIEPLSDYYHVRLRVDGRLQELGRRLQHAEGTSLISRIKVLSGLDISESRMPQDGGANHKTPLMTSLTSVLPRHLLSLVNVSRFVC